MKGKEKEKQAMERKDQNGNKPEIGEREEGVLRGARGQKRRIDSNRKGVKRLKGKGKPG